MTACEAVEAASVFASATIVPLHFEGWDTFSEARKEIAAAVAGAGLIHRLRWPGAGQALQIDR
jgi:hypothetical protein